MRVRDVMDRKAARVSPDDPLRVAAELLALTGASDLAVVDDSGAFMGVLSEGDLLRALMPDFDDIDPGQATLEKAYAFFVNAGESRVDDPVINHVIHNPFTVGPDDQLLQPAALMVSKQIRRLPVVAGGRFLGTVSRADICWALLCDVADDAGAPAPAA